MSKSETPRARSGLTSSILWSLSLAPGERIALSYILGPSIQALQWYALLHPPVVW